MGTPLFLPVRGVITPPIASKRYEGFARAGGFVNDFREGTLGAGIGKASVSRSGTTASRYNSTPAFEQSVAANAPRFWYDFETGRNLGLKIEGSRINSFSNGVLAITSGLPSGLAVEHARGLTTSVVGTGTESGMPYVDIRFSGTTNSSSAYELRTSGINPGVTVGEKVSGSAFMRIVSGSTTNITSMRLRIVEATGAFPGTDDLFDLSATKLKRIRVTRTTTLTGTSHQLRFIINHSGSGVAIDVTCRFALWGHEAGDFVSSVIASTSGGGAITRNADDVTAAFTGQAKGLDVVKFRLDGISGIQPIIQLDDGTDDNRIALVVESGTLYAKSTVSTSDTAAINLGSVSALTDYTVAFSRDTNAFAACVNGGSVGTDSSGALPTGLTTRRYGGNAAGNKMFGTMAFHKYLPYPVSSVQVDALSAAD